MATVKTVRVIDPRIEPQPDPVYAVTVGPKQNQFYSLPASGISDSYVTFNNLTTLGTERAFLDTFELEVTAEITFHCENTKVEGSAEAAKIGTWTFDSFPFNKCCEEIRVNVNGGAFFSQPMSYLRAKERYWDDKKLNDSYGNVCPCNKPWITNEQADWGRNATETDNYTDTAPSRCGTKNFGWAVNATGVNGSNNLDIVNREDRFPLILLVPGQTGNKTITVTWREPIFATPFSSRYDETFGRPLYNITSIDIAFNLQNLGNMIRTTLQSYIQTYEIHLKTVNLLYQVCTIPESVTPPSATIIPYRRIVPYTTEATGRNPYEYNQDDHTKGVKVEISSGQYTLNEIPQAIWVYLGPTKSKLQENPDDGWGNTGNKAYSFNKLAARMEHISISMANTTQILNTATPYDLYRIAKRNGCQDSFSSWYRESMFTYDNPDNEDPSRLPYVTGAGSFLRLIPGTDIQIDQPLVPGANANNMVLQVHATFTLPPTWPHNFRDVALWLLFEYVGVATITPGQCYISMNPLADGSVMNTAPVVSAAAQEGTNPSTVEGSGWMDKLKSVLGVANQIAKDTGIIGKALSFIPGVGPMLSTAAKAIGYGYKRPPQVTGGAVMGMGDFV